MGDNLPPSRCGSFSMLGSDQNFPGSRRVSFTGEPTTDGEVNAPPFLLPEDDRYNAEKLRMTNRDRDSGRETLNKIQAKLNKLDKERIHHVSPSPMTSLPPSSAPSSPRSHDADEPLSSTSSSSRQSQDSRGRRGSGVMTPSHARIRRSPTRGPARSPVRRRSHSQPRSQVVSSDMVPTTTTNHHRRMSKSFIPTKMTSSSDHLPPSSSAQQQQQILNDGSGRSQNRRRRSLTQLPSSGIPRQQSQPDETQSSKQGQRSRGRPRESRSPRRRRTSSVGKGGAAVEAAAAAATSRRAPSRERVSERSGDLLGISENERRRSAAHNRNETTNANERTMRSSNRRGSYNKTHMNGQHHRGHKSADMGMESGDDMEDDIDSTSPILLFRRKLQTGKILAQTNVVAQPNDKMAALVRRLQGVGGEDDSLGVAHSSVLTFSDEEVQALKKGDLHVVFSLRHVKGVKFSKEEFGRITAEKIFSFTKRRPLVVDIMTEKRVKGERLELF